MKTRNLITILSASLLLSSCMDYTEEVDPATLGAPKITSLNTATSASSVGVTLSSAFQASRSAAVSDAGFIYGKSSTLEGGVKANAILSDNTFTASLPLADFGETYYYQAYISNKYDQTSTSDIKSLKIPEFDYYVTLTQPVESTTTSSSIVVKSIVAVADGITVTERGFCWTTDDSTPSIDGDHEASAGIGASFEGTIGDLKPTQTVNIAAYATDAKGHVAYSPTTQMSTSAEAPTVKAVTITPSSYSATVIGEIVSDGGADVTERGVVWATTESSIASGTKVKCGNLYGDFTVTISGLEPVKTYYYRLYAMNSSGTGFSETLSFTTEPVAVTGVTLDQETLILAKGETQTLAATVLPEDATNKNLIWKSSATSVATVDQDGKVTAVNAGTTVITVTTEDGSKTATCKVTVTSATATDLSAAGTANSYIVSSSGTYKIKTVKGNSSTSVGTVSSAVVLWESYGTSTAPSTGDLVKNVTYNNGYITFTSSDKKGNAVIAAKDASGTILWSWHIWMTDKPADQVYNNNAGTMMDRNLGATSAAKGDVKALGLLYQWGRKDPFLGGSSVSYSSSSDPAKAASTITWPSTVASNSSNGTIAYAVANPTTFITYNSSNYDWYYTGSSSTDNTRWQTSGSSKGLYDPCPTGYRVPDGGSAGIWSKAFGTSSYWQTSSNWDSTNKGMDFGTTDKKLGSGTIWYPAAGYLLSGDGSLFYVGYYGSYWSCTPNGYLAYYLTFYYDGSVDPSDDSTRALGRSVRCVKEGSYASNVPVTGVTLNKSSLTLAEGESFTLTATVTPSNATNKNVTWTSSDATVATVSNGKVTAVDAGTTVITVTTEDGSKTATCKVTVTSATATDLSAAGTANSYIVSSSGTYKIKTVKGNSSTSVGTVSSAVVLWESYGTSTKPSVGDLVSNVTYKDGYITFAATEKKGNAVIAAKDADGTILWSWHIWMTYKPADQVYNNNAGTMMDRNLGATSAAKGDVQALGLLYQWGRKDPFLGSSSISSDINAASTITWPSTVTSNSSTGTIAYAVAHPTTFITYNSSNYDWYYTGSSSTDNTRWQTSDSSKGLYDPCPAGYRVPDGGSAGIWSKALGTSSHWTTSSNWDSTNRGMDFGATDKKLGSGTIWYPAAGYLGRGSGSLDIVGYYGRYWSCTPTGSSAYLLYFLNDGGVYPSYCNNRANGQSVRCVKE